MEYPTRSIPGKSLPDPSLDAIHNYLRPQFASLEQHSAIQLETETVFAYANELQNIQMAMNLSARSAHEPMRSSSYAYDMETDMDFTNIDVHQLLGIPLDSQSQ